MVAEVDHTGSCKSPTPPSGPRTCHSVKDSMAAFATAVRWLWFSVSCSLGSCSRRFSSPFHASSCALASGASASLLPCPPPQPLEPPERVHQELRPSLARHLPQPTGKMGLAWRGARRHATDRFPYTPSCAHRLHAAASTPQPTTLTTCRLTEPRQHHATAFDACSRLRSGAGGQLSGTAQAGGHAWGGGCTPGQAGAPRGGPARCTARGAPRRSESCRAAAPPAPPSAAGSSRPPTTPGSTSRSWLCSRCPTLSAKVSFALHTSRVQPLPYAMEQKAAWLQAGRRRPSSAR